MFCNQLIDTVLIGKAHFHFCRVHIHVDTFGRHRDMQYAERISVLHHIGLIPFFYRFGQNLTFDIPSVYKIVFKISVCAI